MEEVETSGSEQVSNAGARREHGNGRVANALSDLEADGVGVGQGQSMSHHSCVLFLLANMVSNIF
jgi:hypothetical protein